VRVNTKGSGANDRTERRDTARFVRSLVRFAWVDLRNFKSARHAVSECFRHAWIVPNYARESPSAGFMPASTTPKSQGRELLEVRSLRPLQVQLRKDLAALASAAAAVRPTSKWLERFARTREQRRQAWHMTEAQVLAMPSVVGPKRRTRPPRQVKLGDVVVVVVDKDRPPNPLEAVAGRIDRYAPRLRFINGAFWPDYDDDLRKLLYYGLGLAIMHGALRRLGVCGVCGKPVVRLLDRAEPSGVIFCGDVCRTAYHNARRSKEQKAEAQRNRTRTLNTLGRSARGEMKQRWASTS
jgi:hypothetical protein